MVWVGGWVGWEDEEGMVLFGVGGWIRWEEREQAGLNELLYEKECAILYGWVGGWVGGREEELTFRVHEPHSQDDKVSRPLLLGAWNGLDALGAYFHVHGD